MEEQLFEEYFANFSEHVRRTSTKYKHYNFTPYLHPALKHFPVNQMYLQEKLQTMFPYAKVRVSKGNLKDINMCDFFLEIDGHLQKKVHSWPLSRRGSTD